MTVPNIEQLLETAGVHEKPLKHLTTIINQLLKAQADVAEAEAILRNVETLPRCCGSKHVDGKGYFYANHGVSDKCPLHGQHPTAPGAKRLRLYIGRKPDTIQELEEAIGNNGIWQLSASDLTRKQARLRRLADAIEESYKESKNFNRWI